jgi:hypothetical protein
VIEWTDEMREAFERDPAAHEPQLYAIVWHSPDEPHPDGRCTRIVTDRDEAVEDAAYATERAHREGAGDHRYVPYQLVPVAPPGGTP